LLSDLKENKMKKAIISIATTLLCICSFAQTPSAEDFLRKYNLLTKQFGADGVGVETVLENWEKAYPEDPDMLVGKFAFYLAKSQKSEVVAMDVDRYLGFAPIFQLKDSTGRMVNYFEKVEYDDELFGESSKAIDKAIDLKPNRLDYRFYKTTALLAYEKDSPDMTLAYLKALIDYNYRNHPQWEYPDVTVDDEFFQTGIQEYCYSFYKLASPAGFEGFKELSEKMLNYNSKNTLFLTNMGSYYMVYKKDNKTALKYYNKVLKIKPDDYPAIKNCVLMARTSKDTKLEKKYLPLLIKYTNDETERQSAQVRLETL